MGTRNFIRRESALHSEVEALLGNGVYTLTFNISDFWDILQGADCNDKEISCLASFATELEKIETLLICFPDCNIIHVPRAHNQLSDFLAKTARSF